MTGGLLPAALLSPTPRVLPLDDCTADRALVSPARRNKGAPRVFDPYPLRVGASRDQTAATARQSENLGRLEAAVLALGAVCSSALITYDGGWLTPALRSYVPWALMPYALLLLGSLTARWLGLYAFARPFLRWGVIIVALSGPLGYIDQLFLHPDAQGGIAMLMIPLVQAMASAPLIIALHISGWRARRAAATESRPRSSAGGRGRAVKIALACATACLALSYALISVLQFLDRQAIDTAKEVDFYIRRYCEANARLPTTTRLRESFPGASPDIGWFYFSDNDTWLRLQYPVRWRNENAIGTPETSEFTATTYAYSIEYHCDGPH